MLIKEEVIINIFLIYKILIYESELMIRYIMNICITALMICFRIFNKEKARY